MRTPRNFTLSGEPYPTATRAIVSAAAARLAEKCGDTELAEASALLQARALRAIADGAAELPPDDRGLARTRNADTLRTRILSDDGSGERTL